MPTITWFEIPADDTERARAFYSTLFDWLIDPFPVEFREDFWMVTTTGEGALSGEMLRRESPQDRIMVYIDVPSVEAYAKQAVDLGGRLVTEKTAVPGMGYFVVIEDTEGNRFGLWETNPAAQKG